MLLSDLNYEYFAYVPNSSKYSNTIMNLEGSPYKKTTLLLRQAFFKDT